MFIYELHIIFLLLNLKTVINELRDRPSISSVSFCLFLLYLYFFCLYCYIAYFF